MLGDILHALTDPATAEDLLTAIGGADIVDQIRQEASVAGVGTGAFLAAKFRHVLDQAGDEVWLDLLGRMARSPEPGLVVLQAMLARTFPDPIATRAT